MELLRHTPGYHPWEQGQSSPCATNTGEVERRS